MVLSSMIGASMVLAGSAGLFTLAIKPEWYQHTLNRKRKNKESKDKNEITLQERCDVYTILFKNMGLMKNKDWIKVNSYVDNPCYALTKFTLSDSLSLSTFVKRLDDIKNKLGVHFLEIYADKTEMCFRCRKVNLPLEPYAYKKTKQSLIQLGLDLNNDIAYWDLTKDPHCGIFAESGAGKSRLTHAIICYILQNIPSAKFYMIDLKRGMEYGRYKDLPCVIGFAKEVEEAKSLIAQIRDESNRRYAIMEKAGYTDYNEYIKDKPRANLKRMFIVIDEIADLVDDRKSKKDDDFDAVGVLIELGRKIRAVGMSLIIGSQRPTTDFIPASLKANLGCIIGMKVLNQRNSQLIIDDNGLEELQQSQAIGKLSGKMTFFRSFYIDNKMIKDIINSLYPKDPVEIEVSNDIQETHYEPEECIDVEYEEDDSKL